ncbi:MAG: hypothetical protein F6K19_47885 [Cyanothece sp. SIO1E1]|nr:hypothetical protein [Cyanothece sp. SIO1E1]
MTAIAIKSGQPMPSGVNQVMHQDMDFYQQQLKVFVQDAWYILEHSNQVKLQSGHRRFLQGQIYQLESEGQQLTIQAHGRGYILQVSDETIELFQSTANDFQRFRAEASRIYRRHISSVFCRVVPTDSQALEL